MSEPTTIRESIESAFETAEPGSAPAPELAVAQAAPEETSVETSLVESTDSPSADLNDISERPRDDQSKSKSKEEPAQEMTPGPKSGPKPQGDKAPASWRPEVRDHWAQLPESVRAEVAKRESEIDKTLKETIASRQYAEAIQKTIAPYEQYIRAENSNPLQAIDNLMSTAAKLRTGSAPELAQMMAGLVQQFGTGRFGPQFVEMLDGALAGNNQGDANQAQIQQVIQQQLAPVQQFMTQFQQAQAMQQQQEAQKAAQEVNGFLERTEFGNDVREEMADLLEVAQRRGNVLSIQDAYRQACMLNPSVRATLQQRAKAKTVQTQTSTAQRARQAAVSVTSSGSPIGAPKMQSDNVRDAIEAAIAMNSK